jgi:gliding motility-associated-like protein
MKKIYFFVILLICINLSIVAGAFAQVPVITSFSPAAGPVGTTVTINGSNFSTTAASNTVYFGATKASVTAATALQLTVTVPAGATYQPFSVTTGSLTAYSAMPFITTFTSKNSLYASDFDPANVAGNTLINGGTGTTPHMVVSADFDGDGLPDLAVVNKPGSGTGSILIYLNNPATPGIFTTLSYTITTITAPTYLAVADLDGDGKLDLVAANTGTNVSVFFNKSTSGTALFSTYNILTTSSTPNAVTIADVDGDGKPDIISSGSGNGNISILRNTITTPGTSSFALAANYSAGTNAYFTAVGDLDGDGKPDLISTNNIVNPNVLTIFQNKSTPGVPLTTTSFASAGTITESGVTTTVNNTIALADMDGDGKLDVIVTNYALASVSVFRNSSTAAGSFTFDAKIDFTTGTNPFNIAIADLDGDGKPDIVVNDYTGTALSILRNNFTSGSISSTSLFSRSDLTTAFPTPTVPTIADFDGDGKPDILTGANSGTNFYIYKNDPAQLPTILSFSPLAGPIGSTVTITGTNFASTAANNVVTFGTIKATVTSASATQLNITVPAGITYQPITVLNNSVATKQLTVTSSSYFSTTFTSKNAITDQDINLKYDIPTGTTSSPGQIVTGDINGDGLPDMLVALKGTKIISVYLHKTSFTGYLDAYPTTPDYTIPVPLNISYMAVGDLDADGKADIAVGVGNTSLSVYLTTATGAGTSAWASISLASVNVPIVVAIADIDGDGKPDILASMGSGSTVSIFRNTSSGGVTSFSANIPVAVGITGIVGGMAVGDIDGDGKPDIVFSNRSAVAGASAVLILRNISQPGFISPTAGVSFVVPSVAANTILLTNNAIATTPQFLTLADIDGDGKLDIATDNISTGVNTVTLFRNNSIANNFSFDPHVDLTTGALPYMPAFADIDGDGKPDMVVANNGAGTVSVFHNTSTGGATLSSSSFAPKIDYTVGASNSVPTLISVTDIDGDGKPDILVPDFVTGVSANVTILHNAPSYAPVITSFAPQTGAAGGILTINGNNFGKVTTNNIVYFGAVSAVVTSASATQLTVTIPVGADYGPISIQNITDRPVIGFSSAPFIPVFTSKNSITTADFDAKFDSGILNAKSVLISDLDGDGKPDVLTTGGNSIFYYHQKTTSTGNLSLASFDALITKSAGFNGVNTSAIGDMDGDGKPDLVLVAYPTAGANGSVVIYKNLSVSGAISFTTAGIGFPTGINPTYVALADLDGDGRLDIIVSNAGSNTISIYRNIAATGVISSASFVLTNTIAVGTNPTSVTAADIDGDGKLDLVVTNSGSNNVSVLRNTSLPTSITFDPGIQTFATGINPQVATLGDLDGDGKIDIIIPNNGTAGAGNTVSVLRNTSTPGAINMDVAIAPFTTGTGPVTATLGDIDGDGKPDVLIANSTPKTLSILRNTSTGSGVISLAPKIDLAGSNTETGVAVGDLDGDGKADILLANNNTLSFFRNDPSTSVPTVTTTTGNTTFTSSTGTQTPIAIDNALTTSEIGKTVWASATVSITGGFVTTQDVLAFTNDGSTMGNITASAYDSTNGILTLTSSGTTATLAQFQAALRAVTYSNTNIAPNVTNRTISFVGNDGSQNGPAATKTIAINSSNANLAAITVSSGAVSPAFTSTTTAYTLSVANSAASITLTPGAAVVNSTVKVNGVIVANGSASSPIALAVGTNPDITIIVTSSDGTTTNSYTITPTRLPSSNADLSNLTLSNGTIPFNTTTLTYTASVANSVNSITLTPTVSEPNATVLVNGAATTAPVSLTVGSTQINVVVTAQDGTTTKTYQVTVTRAPSADASLSAIVMSDGLLTPAFASGTMSYTNTVANSTSSITLTPTVTQPNATITVNGAATASGNASGSIALSVGNNAITTVVTAQNGVTKDTYTVTVTRLPSSNANLSNLTLTNGTIAFDSSTTTYTTLVANNVTSVTLSPTVSEPNATVLINGANASAAIPLTVGDNPINVVVTAQDETTVKRYTVTVTRAPSTDASLSSITLSNGNLSPVFAAATLTYAASVANNISSVTLAPSANQPNATVTVNGIAVTPGSASGGIALNIGDNILNTVVTAQDGSTQLTYKITITRAGSPNADLADLDISNTTLTPAFNANTINYAAGVTNTVSAVTITPRVAEPNATVKVNGTAVASGNGIAITVNNGSNSIATVVTAQDGTTKTYSITVVKSSFSNNADLSALSLSNGTLSPAFSAAGNSYTALVSNATTSINITPTIADATATLKVQGLTVASGTALGGIMLAVGDNIINTVVTAQDNITQNTYTVTVNRAASSNANLTALALSNGTLSPVFNGAANNYTASVGNTITTITLTPTIADANATVSIGGTIVGSGNASGSINLAVGDNMITATVTAQNGTVNIYTITVNRAKSSNANLSSIALSNGILSPVFNASTNNYTASVNNSVTSISLTPTAADATAALTVNGTIVNSGNASGNITLSVGDNIIKTVVTAQDGATINTYTVTVTRAKSSNANLTALTLNSGALLPVFDAATHTYTATVDNSVTTITITPAVADATASVKVAGIAVTSGTASGNIALTVGDNLINVVVTAEDGTLNTYTVTVNRALSANNNLFGLTINNGTLSPVFASTTNNYTATVSTATVSITPTVADVTASVTVNGVAVNSGSASGSIALSVGDNTINTIVTAQNGTAKTYTVTVNRLGVPQTIIFPALSDATYGSADIIPGATSDNTTIPVTYTSSNTSVATITADGKIHITGAGSTTITAAQNGNSTYSAAPLVTQNITVNKAVLNITADDQSKIYGSANPALTVSYSGFVNGDTKNSLTALANALTTATTTSGVNTYPITASGAVSANYSFTYTAGILKVTPAVLTITANNQTKIYGAANPLLTVAYAGFVNGDDATKLSTQASITTTATATSNVNSYPITPSGAVAVNYTISYVAGTLTVTPAALTISANNQTKVYGSVNPTLSVSYTGFLNGDDATKISTPATVTTTATTLSPVNGYPITASGAAAVNYTISYAPGTLTVTKATLTVKADNQNKIYGATNPALTITYTGFAGSDTPGSLTTQATSVTTATATSPVGNYSITPAGAAAANYTFSYAAGVLSVTPAPLTITANNLSKVYGAANPALTLTYTGFVGTDNNSKLTTQAIVSTTAVTASPVNAYPITPAGAAAANYTITYVQGTLTVTPAALTVSVTNVSKAYSAAIPVFTINYTGFITGESKTNLITQATATTTATPASPVGVYPITLSGATSPNYNITYSTAGVLTISKAVLTIAAVSTTANYGSINPTLAVTYTGFVNGDTQATVITTPATATTTAVSTSNAGAYPITASGAVVSANYSITYVAGTLTVNKVALVITAVSQSRPYNTVNPTFTVTYNGFINGDDATKLTKLPTITTTALITSNAGTYPITASAATATNYNITYVAGVLTVTPLSRILTFNALPNKTYGDADFDGGASIDNGDAVTYSTSDNTVATIVNGKIHVAGGGTVIITATAVTNINYIAVNPITQQLIINRASQVITFNPIAIQQKGAGTINANATSTSGLTVFLNSADPLVANINPLTQGINLLRIGTTVITASQPGDNNYLPAADVIQTLQVQDNAQDLVIVHSGFSPNNDGVDDFLIIEGIRDYPQNKLTIVDRNGIKLFEKSNYDNAANIFDGHSSVNGSLMKQGTYFYLLQFTVNGETKKKAGYIILKY